jgi:TPR repeat protein
MIFVDRIATSADSSSTGVMTMGIFLKNHRSKEGPSGEGTSGKTPKLPGAIYALLRGKEQPAGTRRFATAKAAVQAFSVLLGVLCACSTASATPGIGLKGADGLTSLGKAFDPASLPGIRARAELGDVESQCIMADAFASGKLGLTNDYVQAVIWFRKADEQNYAVAQYALGVAYTKGQGVATDETEGAKWYRKAAERNLAAAQYGLGVCYANGVGVMKDNVQAYKWIMLAADQNEEPAKLLLVNIEKALTPDQIAEGQKLAREFKAQSPPSDDN